MYPNRTAEGCKLKNTLFSLAGKKGGYSKMKQKRRICVFKKSYERKMHTKKCFG
jgi:hypothetical protein